MSMSDLCPKKTVQSMCRACQFGGACLVGAAALMSTAAAQDPVPAAATEQAEQATQVASRILPAVSNQPPFDLTQRPGEHPLMPALRVAQDSLNHIDQNIKDYSALLYKQERINGELLQMEVAYVQVRHQPFSVHLFFLSPVKGRECLYSEGPAGTNGNLMAREGSGLKRRIGVVKLDPNGRMAMAGQRYPITKLGVRNLTQELVAVATNDVQFGECEVQSRQDVLGTKGGEKRPVTVLTAVHPEPRKDFRFHKAEIFIDNELRVPIRYAAYSWPTAPGEQPPLEETYTYLNLKVNNGYTDADFSADGPNLFKE